MKMVILRALALVLVLGGLSACAQRGGPPGQMAGGPPGGYRGGPGPMAGGPPMSGYGGYAPQQMPQQRPDVPVQYGQKIDLADRWQLPQACVPASQEERGGRVYITCQR